MENNVDCFRAGRSSQTAVPSFTATWKSQQNEMGDIRYFQRRQNSKRYDEDLSR
jgi:hypothetical protein